MMIMTTTASWYQVRSFLTCAVLAGLLWSTRATSTTTTTKAAAAAAATATDTLEALSVKHVLIPIVMEAEATPFVEHLGLELVQDFFPSQTPFLAFSGVHHKTKVTVITLGKDTIYETGVDNAGTVPVALATFLALSNSSSSKSKVDLVLNAGTCGGFSRKGAAIGDVFFTTGVAFHDRRIPIPGFDTFGIGKLETVNPLLMATKLGFKTGICTTGNSLDHTTRDEEIMLANDASVKDMEAAAIAYISKMYDDVPYLGVKVVTDIVDGGIPTQDEFLANLASAAQSLQTALPHILDYVCDVTKKDSDGEL